MPEHCRHARYVWNLAVEQHQYWQPGRHAPGFNEQCAQLTAARAEHDWLAAGSQTVQQQALRDFAQAMRNFFTGTHRRPTWRKANVHEGFRQVAVKPHHVERLNRRMGRVWMPKVGWVRFRLSRPVPEGVKSYRVTRDRAGRWFIAFADVPDPIAVRVRAPWWVSTAVLRCRQPCRPVNCCTHPASPQVRRSGSRCCNSGSPAPSAAPTGEPARSARSQS